VAPVIAAQADHLTVFQRTANYSVPARNAPLTPDAIAQVKANYSALRDKARATPNGHPFDFSEVSALDVPAEERERRYEAAWQEGGLRFRAVFSDLIRNKQANDTAADFIRAKIASIVKDKATAAMLTPTDHPFAAKRPPIDTGYFETFNRENVALVDVKATPILEITPAGIRTSDREYPLDIIVFATGFDAMTGPLLAMDIRGSGGRSLREDWAAGPRTYLGLQTAGYPNMFTVTGPGSPSVLTNMPVAIEQHTQWITACIRHMRAAGQRRVEAKAEAAEAWVAHVNEAANATLLPLANSSWYLGANVPGKPRVFMPYAGGMAHYAKLCAGVAQDGYRGFAIS
jgi:cation diffusion facilitator CzcD-associated flavoprotein CzcO